MSISVCVNCGEITSEAKRGWTNCWYCSERCERRHVSEVITSGPGGLVPGKPNWLPSHVSNEITRRWEDN